MTRTRTTISIPVETYEVFKRMADSANMSVSMCMGDWLADTADAAMMITAKMEEAKQAPLQIIREMKSLVTGLHRSVNQAETNTVIRQRQADLVSSRQPKSTLDGAAQAAPGQGAGGLGNNTNSRAANDLLRDYGSPSVEPEISQVKKPRQSHRPPSSNTGGKSPNVDKKTTGAK